MADQPRRPPVRVRFRYNVDTGEIEEFLVDDNAPDRSEDYHDKVAQTFASQLGRNAQIEDAGRIRHQGAGEAAPETRQQDRQDEEQEPLPE